MKIHPCVRLSDIKNNDIVVLTRRPCCITINKVMVCMITITKLTMEHISYIFSFL